MSTSVIEELTPYMLPEKRPYAHYEQILIQKVQHFYLTGIINEPAEYIDMIHKISMATSDEIIYIHLNLLGGNLATGMQIINAMKTSFAKIVCSLDGEAYSLGSLIFLAADEFIIHDNSLMMIHNYQGGVYGSGHEQVQELEATVEWFNTLASDYYIPFLSKKELKAILKGVPMWLQAEQIRTRLGKMIAKKTKKLEKAEAKAAVENE